MVSPLNDMARDFRISRRTLFRDLSILRQVGIQLQYQTDRSQVEVVTVFDRIASVLSMDEATAFVALGTKIAAASPSPPQPLSRAITKIAEILRKELSASKTARRV